jgi:oxalate decarboxylase
MPRPPVPSPDHPGARPPHPSRRDVLAAATGRLLMTSLPAQAQGTPESAPADPQPIRDKDGGTDPSPHNAVTAAQNPDLLTPPHTDHGSVPNLKWSFSLSHNRLEDGA